MTRFYTAQRSLFYVKIWTCYVFTELTNWIVILYFSLGHCIADQTFGRVTEVNVYQYKFALYSMQYTQLLIMVLCGPQYILYPAISILILICCVWNIFKRAVFQWLYRANGKLAVIFFIKKKKNTTKKSLDYQCIVLFPFSEAHWIIDDAILKRGCICGCRQHRPGWWSSNTEK